MGNVPPKKGELYQHEWLTIIAIALGLVLLAFLSLNNNEPNPLASIEEPRDQTSQVQVWVDGEVSHPGAHKLPKGSTIEDLLKRVKPLPNADVRRYKPSTKLKDGRHITVRTRPLITVHVSGAVHNEGPIQVPKGSRIEDLIQRLDLKLSADTDGVPRRRKLNNGEEVHIPFAKNPPRMDN